MYHHNHNLFMRNDFTTNNLGMQQQQQQQGMLGGPFDPNRNNGRGVGLAADVGPFGSMGNGGFNQAQTPYQLSVPNGAPPCSGTIGGSPMSIASPNTDVNVTPVCNTTACQQSRIPETPTRPRRRNVNPATMLLTPSTE